MKRYLRGKAIARIAVCAATALAFLASAASAYDRTERFEKRSPREGVKRVIVKNARGDTKITGTKDASDIGCEYTKRARGRNREDVDRLFVEMNVEVRRSGDALVIEAKYPERREKGFFALVIQQYAGLAMDMEIAIPKDMAVAVATGSGDVDLSGVLGAVEIASSSGEITVKDVGGDLEIGVSSGDIVVDGVAGAAELSTSSGDVCVRRIGKDAAIHSSSGDISAQDIGGDLTVSSTSGDVHVEGVGGIDFNGTSGSATFIGVRGGVNANLSTGDVEIEAVPAAAAGYEIRTSSGEIVLTFAKAVPGGFVLKAQTTSGDVSVSLPIKLHKVGRRYLSGIVGDGKSVVVLETSSGDITVTER